jgi:type I restriction enzyme S subunit
MNNWKEVILDNVTSRIGDGLHGTPQYDVNGKYHFINGNNLNNGRIEINSKTKTVNREVAEKHKKPLSDKTILISINGTIGNVAYYKGEKCMLGKSACYINLNEDINTGYMYYTFCDKQFQSYLEVIATGTTIPNVPLKGIRKYAFNLPPLPEQKAIAEVLSSLDDKIDLLHSQNKTLETMAQTLFRQWFVEEADESWEERPLSKIAIFLNGLACQKFPPKNDSDKLPVLKIRELKNGFTDSSDWVSTEVDEKYLVQNGDIIFSWSASLVVKIWDGNDCILNQHLFKVSSKEFPKWFYYLWSKYHLDQFIAIARAHATTMGHIKRGDLDEAMVFVPSKPEIQQMTQTFQPIIDKIIANNIQSESLIKLRNTLLPKLMSGDIRVDVE